MPKPLKVSRAHEIAGLFVVVALAIALAAALLGPRTQRWFTPSQRIAIHLPPEGSLGLRKGGDVQILGSVVGSVENIVVTDAGGMEAEVLIRGNFIRFVRSDSRAIIRKPLGIGDASIEITRGHADPLPARGGYLDAVADKGPTQFMEETLAAIRDEALPALKELRNAVSEYSLLASELRSERGNAQQALRHLNNVGAALEKGEGLAGMLLFDPKPAAELRAALPKLNASIGEMHQTLKNTRAFSERLPKVGVDLEAGVADLRSASASVRSVAGTLPAMQPALASSAEALPGLLLQTQESLRQVQRLTEALQRNWLVRGGMAPAEAGTRIAPERVGTQR